MPSRPLPTDIESLQRLVIEQRAALLSRDVEIEKLKIELARLKRMQFGRSSEQLDQTIAQLELSLEELEASESELLRPLGVSIPAVEKPKPTRRGLPESLPRETVVHEAPCNCPACGGVLRALGEDVVEILEYVPSRFKVNRHVRPKFSCAWCQQVVQAPAPDRPIARGLAGPGLLAHVLVSKYCNHLPLHRQTQIYAREGVDLDRSTLADWVGQSSALLRPLVEALRVHVLGGSKLHADDTPVPVLCPGRGTTKQGRLWTYVRDDRASGTSTPAAVWFAYSADRKGLHPRAHLKDFRGTLQADGYASFDKLYNEANPDHPIREAACWAHVRRKFYDIQVANASPLAKTALERIGELYGVEEQIRGQSADIRREIREARSGPLLDALLAGVNYFFRRVASRNFLTICLMEILTISAKRGLTRARGRRKGAMGAGLAVTRVRSQHSW